MKRLLAMTLSLVVAGWACGAPADATVIPPTTPPENSTSAPSVTSAAPTDAPAPTAPPVVSAEAYLRDEAEADGVVLTVLRVEDPAMPGPLYQAEAGKRLVAVEIVVGNMGQESVGVNPLGLTLVDAEGFAYQAELAGRAGQINTIDLGLGERVRGWVAFLVPEASSLASVKYATRLIGGEDVKISLVEPPAGHTPLTVELTRDVTGLSQSAEADGYSIEINTLEDPTTPGPLYQAEAGQRLVAVEVTVGNVAAEKFSPNVLSIYLVDAEGYVYRAELGAREGQLDLVELGAGEKAKGWAAYSLPEGAVPAYVVFRPNVFAGVALRALAPTRPPP